MTSFKNNWLIQWGVAGLLLGVGFISPVVWWLGLVGLTGVIHLTFKQTSLRQAVFGGLMAWTIKSMMALIWFWSVYPMEWIGIDSGLLQLLLIFIWWFTASVWLGFGGVLFVSLVRILSRYTSFIVTLLTIPFVWVLSEMFGSLVFSIVTIGPGGSITTAFSFGYIGYLLAHHGLLIHVAQLYGVYSLGIMLAAIATVSFWLMWHVANRTYVYVFVVCIVLSSFVSLPDQQQGTNTYSVAIIDTDFALGELRQHDGRKQTQIQLEESVQAALALKPDYILLPEDTRYFNQQNDSSVEAAKFSFQTGGSDVIVVDSGRADDDEKAVVQSFVYNGLDNVVDQSHKRYLVPQGEFMPALYMNALKLFGNGELIEQYSKTVAFEVGSQINQSKHADTSPAVLFCFESVSPWGVRTILEERGSVPFIAHPISHAWFHESQSLWNQLTSMLKIQAIWNQEYIVSAGNRVDAQVFTPSGAVIYPEPLVQEDDWRLRLTTIPK